MPAPIILKTKSVVTFLMSYLVIMFLNRKWYKALICLCGCIYFFHKLSQEEKNAKDHGLYYFENIPHRQGTDKFSVDISSISPDNWHMEQLFHSLNHLFDSPLLHESLESLKFKKSCKLVSSEEGYHY